MNIWFDLTNSPHINFFKQLIEELKSEGHDVTITCRPLANTIDLLDLYHMEYTIVGKHYGKSTWKKAMGFFVRVLELYKFLKGKKIDVGISQSSFYSPIAGSLAGIPTIYTNDNEHAAGNKISFIFANKVLVPEFISKENVCNALVSEKKVTQYKGVKEGIYLWKKYKGFKATGVQSKKIYVRTEPQTAQYYKGKSYFLDPVLESIKDDYQVIILPRNEAQAEHYKGEQYKGIVVCDKPLQFDEIAKDCFMFIGAGGTMTREMAVVGIPTISVYQDALLDVDKFLIDNGIMMYEPKLNAQRMQEILASAQSREASTAILDKGEQTYNYIKQLILSYEK